MSAVQGRTLMATTRRAGVDTADTAQTITLTGVAGQTWLLKRVNWSYDGTPTGGALTLTTTGGSDNGVVGSQKITSGGPGFYEPAGNEWVSFGSGVTVTIVLAAGGSGVKGVMDAVAKLVDAQFGNQ